LVKPSSKTTQTPNVQQGCQSLSLKIPQVILLDSLSYTRQLEEVLRKMNPKLRVEWANSDVHHAPYCLVYLHGAKPNRKQVDFLLREIWPDNQTLLNESQAAV
jgi:hypothetical protein